MSASQWERRPPPHVKAAVIDARSFGASVEISKRGNQHYGLRIAANGSNRLVIVSSTCSDVNLFAIIKSDVRKTLEVLGVDTGKGKRVGERGARRPSLSLRQASRSAIVNRRQCGGASAINSATGNSVT